MKKILLILLLLVAFINNSNAFEKKDCKQFKIFSKEYASCIAENLKNISLKVSEKVKKDVSIAAGDVKEDTEKLIDKGKEKIN